MYFLETFWRSHPENDKLIYKKMCQTKFWYFKLQYTKIIETHDTKYLDVYSNRVN